MSRRRQGASSRAQALRLFVLGGLGIGLAALSFHPARPMLVWNFSASAPVGLYHLSDHPLQRGDLAIIRPSDALKEMLAALGADHPDHLLLKPIAGLPGDLACRRDEIVSLNDRALAHARALTSTGAPLPVWAGCAHIPAGEVFVLSAHPDAFDSRYFGSISQSAVLGLAQPLATLGMRAEGGR